MPTMNHIVPHEQKVAFVPTDIYDFVFCKNFREAGKPIVSRLPLSGHFQIVIFPLRYCHAFLVF